MKIDERIDNLTAIVQGTPAERLHLAINAAQGCTSPFTSPPCARVLDLKEEAENALQTLLTRSVSSSSARPCISDQHLDKLANKAKDVWRTFHREQPLKAGMKKKKPAPHARASKPDVQDGILRASTARSCAQATTCSRCRASRSRARTPRVAFEDALLDAYEARGFEPYDKHEVLELDLFKNKATEAIRSLVKNSSNPSRSATSSSTTCRPRHAGPLTPEMFISKTYYAKSIALVTEMINKNGEMKLAEFRDAIESSRKYAVAIL